MYLLYVISDNLSIGLMSYFALFVMRRFGMESVKDRLERLISIVFFTEIFAGNV